MRNKWRNSSGLKHEPKLDRRAVAQIRAQYRYGSRTTNLRTLAADYGVSINTIHCVIINKTWKCEEYALRLADHPIQEKRQFNAMLECQRKAENMYADFLAAKGDAKATRAFLRAYGK
jgi:hypothetical protein